MRKHIDYYYKSYDKENTSNLERIESECFNEYGYNFESNSKRVFDFDKIASRTDYQNCLKKIREKR